MPGTVGTQASTWQPPTPTVPAGPSGPSGVARSTSTTCKTPARGATEDEPMTADPINLAAALAAFDDVYSPRIVTKVNDYDVRIAHARGDHVWQVHDDTDELFLVLDGEFHVALRDGEDGGERT